MPNHEPRNNLPRITFEIDDDLMNDCRDLIPWGLQAHILRILLRGLLSMIREHGTLTIAAIISGEVTALDVLHKRMMERKDEH